MKLQALNKNILLSDCENFDPFISCECGQYFRFVKNSDIEYSIFACGRRLNIEKTAIQPFRYCLFGREIYNENITRARN